ncbi:MAG: hypothetical protein JST54_18935 [Deltaproteobacteria bacterium]|nr:hypothetical protein [Deltaproteobacteria bacterium]
MKRAWPIFWESEEVGRIVEPKFDGFHLYGEWEAAGAPILAEFLARLGAGEQLWVEVGGAAETIAATIEEVPRAEVEMVMRPRQH